MLKINNVFHHCALSSYYIKLIKSYKKFFTKEKNLQYHRYSNHNCQCRHFNKHLSLLLKNSFDFTFLFHRRKLHFFLFFLYFYIPTKFLKYYDEFGFFSMQCLKKNSPWKSCHTYTIYQLSELIT